MATARRELINVEDTPFYHCTSRCVRQAFLCGEDVYSGRNFDHRKEWVRARLHVLAEIFAIDICAYAVLSNHLHLVLFINMLRNQSWSDEEVIARYTKLHPMTKIQLESLGDDKRQALIEMWRNRLCSISWFMRALSGFIARKANKEEGRSGRFWEGRFHSQALLDKEGVLMSMAYVDLNPVRAGLSSSLRESEFTSIQVRIAEYEKSRNQKKKSASPKHLMAFEGQKSATKEVSLQLPCRFEDYLLLLSWTGSAILEGKRHALEDAPALLHELGMDEDEWVAALGGQVLQQVTCLGNVCAIERHRRARGRKWLCGIGLARRLAA